ncbi:hypothetical protein [Streptomyces silvisoli]|uniref:Uncharacterized protein n=1 Tax=Streptomyces silvisoli TaxID=3034235 RepID=A0ABT5ZWX9_9ACTN|nr:hypothetical protein [Streptomyces silvisoli]MDF3294335.1 hypothetical protein [Streptomyces silvisoli]
MSTMTEQTARPSTAWRMGVLAVPLFAAVAAVCFVAHVSLANDHSAQQAASCTWLSLSWTVYATAYGAVLLAVAAVAVHFGMFRRAKRNQQNATAVWQGWLSLLAVAVATLCVLAGGIAVVLTHMEAADLAGKIGTHLCEG